MRLSKQLAMESNDSPMVDPGVTPEELPSDHLEQVSRDCEELASLMDQSGVYQNLVEQFPAGTVLTPSEERLVQAVMDMSLAGTGFSVESLGAALTLEGMAASVIESIKKALAAIIEKIKKFIAWVTGNKSKADKQHAQVAEGLKSEAGKEAMKEMADPEKQKAAEQVSTESHVSPAMMRISARQLARYTAQAGRSAIVFVDDIVWEMCEQLEFFRHCIEAQKKLSEEISKLDDNVEMAVKMDGCKKFILQLMHELKAQSATTLLGSQGTPGALAFKVCGVLHFEFDPATTRARMVSHDVDHDYNRHFVIGIRDANKLTMHYDEYVKRCRTVEGQAIDNHAVRELESIVSELHGDFKEEAKSHSGEIAQEIMKVGQVIAVFGMAMTFILRASMSLDHDLMKWVPNA